MGNTHVLAADDSARLYAAAATELNICVYADGTWDEFLSPRPGIPHLAIDASDIYISWDGVVRKYDTSGLLVDSLFTRGTAQAIGPPGPFEGVIVSRPESLLAIDPVTKEEPPLLVGPNSTGIIAFNDARDLFVSQVNCRRILHVTASVSSTVDDPSPWGRTLLAQVWPNPFSREATVSFQVPEGGRVRFEILDLRGRRLALLCDRRVADGRQRLSLTLPNLPCGVYFLRGRSKWGTATTRLTVLR